MAMRLLMTAFTVDSARHEKIRSPAGREGLLPDG